MVNKAKPKAILYARFSPRPNADKCDSVEQQLIDMRRWCMKRNFRIRSEHYDKALSGKDADRPGLGDALLSLTRGSILLVRSFDRLYRDNTMALHVIRHEIEKRGAKLVSVNEPNASIDSPDSRLIRNILLTMAEYNRENISALTRKKMRQHQKNGRRMSNICPYGWKIDPRDNAKMLPDGYEREIINKILDMKSREMGNREIARKLIEMGCKTKMGGKWGHATVGKILEREGLNADGDPLYEYV